MATIAYVDGFNLYFGVLKSNPEWKWLDLVALMQKLRPHEEIERVHYFSALVDPKALVSLARERQTAYIKALGSCPKIKLKFGSYQERTVTCRSKCLEQYKVPEEKKTDVSIAVQMLDDAIYQEPTKMIVVSADSDLEPAVAWVRKRRPQIKITVYVPQLPDEENPRRHDAYKKIGVTSAPLPLGFMDKCQFPDKVQLGSGRYVSRPIKWK